MSFPSLNVAGLNLSVTSTVQLTNVNDAQFHRFVDGRISLPRIGGGGTWTTNGSTWTSGIDGPGQGAHKCAIELGNNETLSLHRTCLGDVPGPYDLSAKRSTNNWGTVVNETVVVDTPLSVPLVGDAGDTEDALLLHHGIEIEESGDLIATFYGNYTGDIETAKGYPEEYGMRKFRTEMLRSRDGGRTWGEAQTIGYNKMLARGTDPDYQVKTYADCGALTQEGMCEADLIKAPNGDFLCFMRSGGRLSFPETPVLATPLYMSRRKKGETNWSTPVAIVPFGCNPCAVTVSTDVIVLTFSRPGQWVIFSDDNGVTWKGMTQVSGSDNYTDIVVVDEKSVLLGYHNNGFIEVTRLSVSRTGQPVPPMITLLANSHRITAGQSSILTTKGLNARNGVLNGGPWNNQPLSTSLNHLNTGALSATTQFSLTYESVSSPGTYRTTEAIVHVA